MGEEMSDVMGGRWTVEIAWRGEDFTPMLKRTLNMRGRGRNKRVDAYFTPFMLSRFMQLFPAFYPMIEDLFRRKRIISINDAFFSIHN